MKREKSNQPFERILPFRDKPDARQTIRALLNLGPKSSGWLVEAGIHSVDQIRTLGPIEVCRRLRVCGYPVSILMAYALEGALTGCHWNMITWEAKQSLRADFVTMKKTSVVGKKPPNPAPKPAAKRDRGSF